MLPIVQAVPRANETLRTRALSLVGTLSLALALLGGVLAADLPKLEASRVQEVVQSQLHALAADDARKAFALADPGIRSKFESAEQFVAMVRAHYPMVHRPATVLFLKPEADGEMALQRVRLTDAAGSAWIATYLLARQKDRRWRITACLVVPDSPKVLI